MKEITIQMTEAQEKAQLTKMIDIQQHWQNAFDTYSRKTMEKVIEEHTDKNARKLTRTNMPEAENIVNGLTLETAAERTERINREMLEILES